MTYLYVNVVFALDDDLNVGVVNGLLVVLDPCRPVSCRSQHLHSTREKRRLEGKSRVEEGKVEQMK